MLYNIITSVKCRFSRGFERSLLLLLRFLFLFFNRKKTQHGPFNPSRAAFCGEGITREITYVIYYYVIIYTLFNIYAICKTHVLDKCCLIPQLRLLRVYYLSAPPLLNAR